METIRVKTEDGSELLIEAVETDNIGTPRPAGGKSIELSLEDLSKKIDNAISFIRHSGTKLTESLMQMDASEAEIKISIGFSVEGNIVLVKTGGSASLEISLKWKKS